MTMTDENRTWTGAADRNRGFTLIELMIVVAIIAVLAALAYPTYTQYITKTRRNAATACLSEYANYMERYYTTNLTYVGANAAATWPTLDCAAQSQTGDYYTYSLSAAALGAATYTVLAAPQGVQRSRDPKCGVLGLNQAGQRYYQTNKIDTTGLEDCWK